MLVGKPTNRTAVLFLLTTIVLMTGVTVVLLNVKTYSGLSSITGLATDSGTGTSTLTISQSTSITSQVSSIAFGSGYVNSSCTACVMDSNNNHNQTTAGTDFCCITFENVKSGFLLENTGNVNLSINYSCSGSCDSTAFIGGTSPFLGIKVTNNSNADQTGETGATDSVDSCVSDGAGTINNTDDYQNVTPSGWWLCGNYTKYSLDFADASDALVIDLNVSIPVDVTTGAEKTATFTFKGLATG